METALGPQYMSHSYMNPNPQTVGIQETDQDEPCWVAAKKLKFSYNNGYIVINMASPM